MKVLIVAQHLNFFRNLEPVVRALCGRGHTVVFLHGLDLDDPRVVRRVERRKQKGSRKIQDRGLLESESIIAGLTSGHRPAPTEGPCRALRFGRQLMNRAVYLRKQHPSPDRVIESIVERDMPPELLATIHKTPWNYVLASAWPLEVWRWLEDVSPPSRTICAALEEIAPDVALVVPTVWPKELVEADYIHAARSLGIPTIGYAYSWDNLTSKGTVHVVPDQYVVWNEPMAREAIDLHGIPPESVRITGAPHLDHLFEPRPTVTRAEVCAAMGCDPERPYVLYLCSSKTLMASEADVVTRLADAFARERPAGTPTLIVRPHPKNPAPWRDYTHPGVVVHPRGGDLADSAESWQHYRDQLTHSACVFGINTTAFLEAVVAGKPCLTIVADEFWPAQGRTGHFRHLLQGNFLDIADDVTGVARRVSLILDGVDEKRAARSAFARWFLRPCGIERSAAGVVADLIERAALPARGDAPALDTRDVDLVPGLTLESEGVTL